MTRPTIARRVAKLSGVLRAAAMKLDRFTDFMLPSEARRFLDRYRSPELESSICKNIPIDQLEQGRELIRLISSLTGRHLRVIFRGPRRDPLRGWCRREDARKFAIYFR